MFKLTIMFGRTLVEKVCSTMGAAHTLAAYYMANGASSVHVMHD